MPILEPGRKEDQGSHDPHGLRAEEGVASGKITRVLPNKRSKAIPGEGQPQMPSIQREKLNHSHGLTVSQRLKGPLSELLQPLDGCLPGAHSGLCWWLSPGSSRGGEGSSSVPLP